MKKAVAKEILRLQETFSITKVDHTEIIYKAGILLTFGCKILTFVWVETKANKSSKEYDGQEV